MRNMLVPFFLIAGSIFAVTHILALELYLYWRYPWMDWPMHFMGGIVIAFGVFSLAVTRIVVRPQWLTLRMVLLLVAAMAIGWEIYEVIIGTTRENNYLFDTAMDFLLGMSGGALGYYIANRFYNSKY